MAIQPDIGTRNEETWVLIPAFNESERIRNVVDDLRSRGYTNIIIVDDCSTDMTWNIIKDLPVVALKHPINRGQGASLRTGTEYFLNYTDGNYLVHFDGDGQHRTEDIQAMLLPLIKGKADITTGSRFLKKSSIRNVPRSKRVLLKLSVLFNRIMYGVRATDAHNGFRAMTRKAAQMLTFQEDRMEHASEIAALIVTKKLSHVEVPVIIHYHEYGQSYVDAIRMGVRLILRKILH